MSVKNVNTNPPEMSVGCESENTPNRPRKPLFAVVGNLMVTSPLRTVFPDGVVPLMDSECFLARVCNQPGGSPSTVYLLDPSACADDERERLAGFLGERFKCSIDVAREAVGAGPIPIVHGHLYGIEILVGATV